MNAIERSVLELIGEDPDSPDVFVDTDSGIAPIRDAVNDAIQEIAMVTGAYKREYLLPLRDGQMFYRFKLQNGYLGWVTDVYDIDRKLRLDQISILALSNYDPRWMVGEGIQEKYLQIGEDVIGFYKKPSASSGMMQITIVEIPHAYSTETEKVKLRDSFHYAAVEYAVGEYWATRGDPEEAVSHGQIYLDALGVKDRYFIPHDKTSRRDTNAA